MKFSNLLISISIVVATLSSSACSGGDSGKGAANDSGPYEYETPTALSDGWPVGSPADVNMAQDQIVRMMRDISANVFTGIDSVVIVRNGTLVHEAYFNGYSTSRRHDLRSATKSITSMLVGISIDQGLLPGAETAVLPYISDLDPIENWDDRKTNIRIHDFLTMSSGLDCDDSTRLSPGNEEHMYLTQDWVQFIWNLPMLNDPGAVYSYCTGGVVVLGDLISKVAGKGVDEFANDELFAHLNITDFNWEYTPAGQVDTGGHIHMVPRDMAKLGEVMLHNGMWNGQPVVSESWIQDSTQQRIQFDARNGYGFLWWTRNFGADGEHPSFLASGNGGQYIFVIPSLDLVIVFTGRNYNSSLGGQPVTIIEEYIIPSMN